MRRIALALLLCLTACSSGVKTTPGLTAYEAGDAAAALPVLQAEWAQGRAEAAYALGMMHLEGRGLPKDAVEGERLLLASAMKGDPRAVKALSEFYRSTALCKKDEELARHWASLGFMRRNLVTGIVEIYLGGPELRPLARLYANPCPGRPVRADLAASLEALSRRSRTTFVYIP